MQQELKDYIDQWGKQEQKPKNEAKFIELFTVFMDSLSDCRDIQFDGDGAYFGNQVTIVEDNIYVYDKSYSFEIAYCDSIISVYRGDNEGFWVPEYIKLNKGGHPEFDAVQFLVYRTLVRLFGINTLNPTI